MMDKFNREGVRDDVRVKDVGYKDYCIDLNKETPLLPTYNRFNGFINFDNMCDLTYDIKLRVCKNKQLTQKIINSIVILATHTFL